MHKTKNTLLIIAAIVIVGCLLYIPQMKGLGLYRDDWNNFYNLTVRGTDTLVKAYEADRPADGYLIAVLYRFFGTNIMAYHIWNLCCRILGSIFFALSLLIIWPRTPKMAGLAGLLAVAFPGFLQQIDGIAYVPHQTAMLCFMFSLWLTALACTPGQKSWNVLFTFISMLFSFASMMLMEYYVGMEIYRFGLIYMMNREQAGKSKPRSFFKCLLSYLPYLIPMAGFVAWRVFFFTASRTGADVMTEIIQPFLIHPRHEIADLGVRILKNLWKLFAGVWTIPAYNFINGMGMMDFIKTLIPAAVILAAGQIFLFLMHRKKTDESVMDANNESAQWLWYGLICGSIAILPLIITKHDINFTASLDRFAWPGMIGAILFLTGLLGSLRNRGLRNLLTMAAILLAVFVQWENQAKYVEIWNNTVDYWQQLIWRAPSIQEGTTIVTAGAVLAEEDYEIFAPASMIYYPYVNSWAPVSAEILNDGTVRDIKLEKKIYRNVREIYTEKDYQQLLAISKPYASTCLRVIDGENPLYSLNEFSKIPQIGSYSKLDQILTDSKETAIMPFFLPEELEHGWCYYFEKMELALQMDDPDTAAQLADEAAGKEYKAGDPVEWVPVIEAYAQTGRTSDALETAELLQADEMMAYNACRYFRAKDDADVYAEVTALLCGEASTASEDTDVAEKTVDMDETALIDDADETAVEETEKTAEVPAAEEPVETPEPIAEDEDQDAAEEQQPESDANADEVVIKTPAAPTVTSTAVATKDETETETVTDVLL